ncbi:hypothetical protein GCM10011613_13650 [Cellvibrio zantedeschiae]|uniref:CHRD domain-containing protein n=1 Tax=Cellvibrio zantedeschiae TaxID=1237077 RepID=A0ABQ3B1D3_9GAMM|nr:hypothetical protein [Cellvibrio zantedeschiae]GGY70454.1 hypothetical protein GCM10011613_13650 [Cellvibrio zantedeschiae]
MNLTYPKIILLISLLLIGLSGCHEQTSETTPGNAINAVKKAKPGAAIKLASSPTLFINANEIVKTELLFDVADTSGQLHLEFFPSNGLDILDTSTRASVDLQGTKPVKIPVALRALENGRYYLNIHASIDSGESVSSRSLAVILQVGPLLEKSTQFKKTSGEQVISLPAQETISNQ